MPRAKRTPPNGRPHTEEPAFIPCVPKTLLPHLVVSAAQEAIKINPRNAVRPATIMMMTALVGVPPTVDHLAMLTAKYWGSDGAKLTVSFMDNPSTALRSKILLHMNAWASRGTVNVQFREVAGGGQVRIARVRGSGYWSYLGVDALAIPSNQQTMNLDSFTESTPDSEFFRVVRHETGHVLAFPHEHMRRQLVARLDPQKTIAYFMRTQGWSAADVRAQVLTPLDDATLRETPDADQLSIMTYQLPGAITVDGRPIIGGTDIDETDYAFAASVYPVATPPPPPPPPPAGYTLLTLSGDLKAGTYKVTQ